MSNELSASAKKVQDALNAFGLTLEVQELPSSTRTAKEAAESVGCEVGQIAKSLLFMGKETGKPVLVIASGSNRVNEKKVGDLISEPIAMASPDFVREKTGFAIGGVPPAGHTETIETYIDEDLLGYDVIWAAAGTPRAVFRLTPRDLMMIARGTTIKVK